MAVSKFISSAAKTAEKAAVAAAKPVTNAINNSSGSKAPTAKSVTSSPTAKSVTSSPAAKSVTTTPVAKTTTVTQKTPAATQQKSTAKTGIGATVKATQNSTGVSPTKTTYYDTAGKAKTGYIINGRTYSDSAGTSRVAQGSVVKVGGNYYKMGDTGGELLMNYTPPATTPLANATSSTPTTILRNGQSINGYIKDGVTYDNQGNRIQAGDVVTSANGTKYLMTAGGKGVDITNGQASQLYGMDTNTFMPNTTNTLGNVYNLNGQYYDANTGQLAGGGYVLTADGSYVNTSTGQKVFQEQLDYLAKQQLIEQQLQQQQDALLAAQQAATAASVSDVNAAAQEQQQQLDAAGDNSAITVANQLDNLALMSAAKGDMGGIGQKQYSDAANAGDQRALEIQLEMANLKTDTANQVAQLEAQGKQAEAQIVASLASKKMELLIAEQDKLQAALTDKQNTTAALLGTYNGQKTLAAQQAEAAAAQSAQALAADTANTNYNRALQRLQLGLFSAADAQTLGVSADQAQNFANRINLSAQIDLEGAKLQLQKLRDSLVPKASRASSGSESSYATTTTNPNEPPMGTKRYTYDELWRQLMTSKTAADQASLFKKLYTEGDSMTRQNLEGLATYLQNIGSRATTK